MGFFDKLFKRNKGENEIEVKQIEEIEVEEVEIEEIEAEEIEAEEIEAEEIEAEEIEVEEIEVEEIEVKEIEVEKIKVEQLEADEAEVEEIEVEEIEVEVEEIEVEEDEIENLELDPSESGGSEKTSETKKGFFSKLKEGLNKTRQNIMSGVDNVLSSFTKIDEDLFEELEEALIMSDIGVETTTKIIKGLRERVKRARATEVKQVKQLLIEEITEILENDETELKLQSPTIILVIGVNGVGKTTTIGKLASIYKQQGNKVLLAAADTFRAAAIDQLEVWGKRSNIDVIKHQENSDPAAVIYDAVHAAKARHTDILICDTAGRLHNKKNLMEELKKIFKVIGREYPEAQKEVFLVLDGTTGQNALQQAKLFKEVADITGIVLTKLDGTAKGGIVIAIKSELNIPVRYVGVGESINDMQEFSASDFAKALFNE